jgi:hypothetical protein
MFDRGSYCFCIGRSDFSFYLNRKYFVACAIYLWAEQNRAIGKLWVLIPQHVFLGKLLQPYHKNLMVTCTEVANALTMFDHRFFRKKCWNFWKIQYADAHSIRKKKLHCQIIYS